MVYDYLSDYINNIKSLNVACLEKVKLQCRSTHCNEVTRVSEISLNGCPFSHYMTNIATNKPLFHQTSTFS